MTVWMRERKREPGTGEGTLILSAAGREQKDDVEYSRPLDLRRNGGILANGRWWV